MTSICDDRIAVFGILQSRPPSSGTGTRSPQTSTGQWRAPTRWSAATTANVEVAGGEPAQPLVRDQVAAAAGPAPR